MGMALEAAAAEPISAAFGSCCSFVIDRLEGGGALVNDAGGITRFGVSSKAHPDVDVLNLTRLGAFAIYHARYWLVLQADKLPRGLDLAVYDASVNMGTATAVRMLQRVLRVEADGIMGPETLAAVRAFRPQSELRARYHELRLRSYEAIVEHNPARQPDLFGWRCRVMRIADEAGRVGGVPDPILFGSALA
jgi:lysozyme family protein